MEQSIAAAAAWALVLLCVALYRSGQWRMAIPIASEVADAPPVAPADGDDEAAGEVEPAARRFRLPVGLAGVVVATAAVRISLLVALGR
ncbi:MAG: hypothetical protein NVSMB23_30250 [Myxococcales bacterium]